MAMCRSKPLRGKTTSILFISLGNGHVSIRSRPWMLCSVDVVEAIDRSAISMMLRESAFSSVGFLG